MFAYYSDAQSNHPFKSVLKRSRNIEKYSFTKVESKRVDHTQIFILYDVEGGADMGECAQFVVHLLNEAEPGIDKRCMIIGTGGTGVNGAVTIGPNQYLATLLSG